MVKSLFGYAGDVRGIGFHPGLEDPLEEGMATYSSIFALENLMDRGAWQTRVHRVTQTQTQLKQLSTHALT